ncbi:MAG TPA: hypothetical protein VLC97_17365 [Rhodanobacteraceae bacterium]|nr:hypothetical protein [Rhodanobacteraceae bacterium]
MIRNNMLGLFPPGATAYSMTSGAGIRRHGSRNLIGRPAETAGDACSAANIIEFMQRDDGATENSNGQSIALEISECISTDALFGEPLEHWRCAAGLDDILTQSRVGGDDR